MNKYLIAFEASNHKDYTCSFTKLFNKLVLEFGIAEIDVAVCDCTTAQNHANTFLDFSLQEQSS